MVVLKRTGKSIPAGPGHCSSQTEVWLWSFGEVIQHIPSPT